MEVTPAELVDQPAELVDQDTHLLIEQLTSKFRNTQELLTMAQQKIHQVGLVDEAAGDTTAGPLMNCVGAVGAVHDNKHVDDCFGEEQKQTHRFIGLVDKNEGKFNCEETTMSFHEGSTWEIAEPSLSSYEPVSDNFKFVQSYQPKLSFEDEDEPFAPEEGLCQD